MAKFKKGSNKNAFKKSQPTRCEDRKALRKADRKFTKMKKAINNANFHKTNKVCINKNDLEIVKLVGLLENNPLIQNSLKGKVLSNKSNDLSNSKKKKKKKKKKNKKVIDSLENEDNFIEPDDSDKSSFKLSNSIDLRMAQLQEFVNRESNTNNKGKQSTINTKSKGVSNTTNSKGTKIKDKLIDDEDGLIPFGTSQDEDDKTISLLQNKLDSNMNKKKKSLMPKPKPNCGLFDFEELLNDIESGNMNNKSHLYTDPLDSDEDKENNSEDSDMNESEDNHEIDKSENDSDSSILENSHDDGNSNSDDNSALETDEECDDMFLNEATEDKDCDDDDELMNDEEEKLCATFEGGSSFDNRKSSHLNINNIFELYESDEDLDGFVVDDDVIEYESDSPKKKRKRIRVMSESPCKSIQMEKRLRIESIGTDSDEDRDNVIFKSSNRMRIESTDSDEDGDNVIFKSSGHKSIIKKGSSKKRVRFSLPDDSVNDDSPIDTNIVKKNSEDKIKIGESKLHEDIYGRLLDEEGNVIKPNYEKHSNTTAGTYVPPHLRKLKEINVSGEKKEHLAFLHRKIKGLLNRLGESNMQYISNQLEDLYLKNSRNDMNETLNNLLMEAIVMPTLTSEKSNRRIQEHALLISILSTNVGSEVGAHILTEFVVKFIDSLDKFTPSENVEEVTSKELNNLLLFVCYIYSFKVVGVSLMYDIIVKLLENFESKQIDLLLTMLSTVGFCLRQDNAVKLKEIILNVQKLSKEKAAMETGTNFTRVRFMLEILTSIKNNNMKKVPNYDPEVTKNFQSLFKKIVKKGRTSSQLNVSLGDLLKSQTMGKWWVIGSAWSDDIQTNARRLRDCNDEESNTQFNDKFMKKAMKLRLTRPPRINILYALTEGATDKYEAFNKLLQIKLTPSQEIEIFNVLLICNNKYKFFNITYVEIAILLIKYKGKFRKLLQTSLWDKFNDLASLTKNKINNLSLFTSHLIAQNVLDLFVLKNFDYVNLSDLDTVFLRQTLRSLCDHALGNCAVTEPFKKLTTSKNLKMLRQCLRAFIQMYVIPKSAKPNAKKQTITMRANLALDILSNCDGISL